MCTNQELVFLLSLCNNSIFKRSAPNIKQIPFLLLVLQVTLDRLWKVVYNELGGCPGSTSAATCTRRHYER